VAGHLRHAYPGIELQRDGGNSFFVDEFVFLNKAINSPAKTQVSVPPFTIEYGGHGRSKLTSCHCVDVELQ
jgi:hypothetical protein